MTIYTYDYDKDFSLKQGDILKNIPYLKLNFLVKSTYEFDKPRLNQCDKIISEIIENGEPIQIETFLNSTFVILATQDCDIRPEYNLTFFPLKIINPSKKKETRSYFKDRVRETTRFFYLPKLKKLNFPVIGPFYAILQLPFTIPYDLIEKNLEKCWFARINEYATKVYVAKISHYYTRLPFEELIFAENEEICNYLEEYRDKFKRNRSRVEDRIEEIKIALKTCDREEDINKIPFNSYLK